VLESSQGKTCHTRLGTAAHTPTEHLDRKRAVQALVARWGRNGRTAGEEAFAAPAIGQQASVRGSTELLQEAAEGFVALRGEERGVLVAGFEQHC
jgi:hypothetical protein